MGTKDDRNFHFMPTLSISGQSAIFKSTMYENDIDLSNLYCSAVDNVANLNLSKCIHTSESELSFAV